MGKGDARRPEAVKGAWDANWRRIFGKTEAELVTEHRDHPPADEDGVVTVALPVGSPEARAVIAERYERIRNTKAAPCS